MNASGSALKLVVVTGCDSFLRAAEIRDGIGGSYQKRAAVVCLSPGDLKRLDIHDGASVELKNEVGSIVVRAKSDSSTEPGTGYMPDSLYTLRLTGYDPEGGRPATFKRIEVTSVPAGGDITPVSGIQGI